jgi:hypothetical protein
MDNYQCPFCGEEVTKESVLFVYSDFSSYYQDTLRTTFLTSSSEDYPLLNGDLFPDLYYIPTEENIKTRNADQFPLMIAVDLSTGLAPAELEGSPDTPESGYNKPAPSINLENLSTRACPFCHCHLPNRFGEQPIIKVTLMGGRAAGKTAFLIALIQQLNRQLAANLLGSVDLLPESKAYMEPQIEYYVKHQGNTLPTKKERLFPIVFNYQNSYSADDRACYIVFYDIAGEGMNDINYLSNHNGIENASIALLLLDPNQLNNGGYSVKQKPQYQVTDVTAQPSAMVSEFDSHEYFSENAATFIQQRLCYCKGLSSHIEYVLAVLSKMDLPLQRDSKLFGGADDVTVKNDLGMSHYKSVSLPIISAVHMQLFKYYQYMLKGADIISLIRRQFAKSIKVYLLGVSTYTREKSNNEYTFVNGYTEQSPKHRIIEPFLVILWLTQMVSAKDNTTQTNSKKQKGKKPPRIR